MFVVLSAFDTGVELIEFVEVFVAFVVPTSLVLLERVFVFVMLEVAVVLVSEVVFLLSLCLVVLSEMNIDSNQPTYYTNLSQYSVYFAYEFCLPKSQILD